MANRNTLWVLIAVIAILVVGMLIQKNYSLFATLPTGQYIQFRTTSLSYVSGTGGGSAIAYNKGTCGGDLTAYGYATTFSAYFNDCVTTFIQRVSSCGTPTKIMDIPGGWLTGSTGASLWSCSGKSLDSNIYVCDTTCNGDICVINEDQSQVKHYYTGDTDASLVSTAKTESIDTNLEVTCGSGTCTPSCTGKTCGDDGCGGSCGTCTSPLTCNSAGQCVSSGGSCVITDTNGNNKVDRDELGTAIVRWVSGT